MDIKYIYYEIKHLRGDNFPPPCTLTMENENVLMLKPKTNSKGVHGFRHVTDRQFKDRKEFSVTDQYWIDLEKYNMEKFQTESLHIEECLTKLRKRLDENR
jgi:hypothetical protein